MSKNRVFSGLHFPAFGLNTERYEVYECGKIRTRKNSVFGQFLHSVSLTEKIGTQNSIYEKFDNFKIKISGFVRDFTTLVNEKSYCESSNSSRQDLISVSISNN